MGILLMALLFQVLKGLIRVSTVLKYFPIFVKPDRKRTMCVMALRVREGMDSVDIQVNNRGHLHLLETLTLLP